ncbi:MAG: ribosome biogenesis GTPase YlqF [Oscillospiraceae bacterium]|jgi:ribosome biogenesis GTPase A|nr:ribosome biogenesis GTPase YlqF [Oscillospiraceae bacterium]
MNDTPNVQWFPGHMARTRRQIREALPLVDAVVELRDARLPESSRNPELDTLTAAKPRIVLLNKCDLADEVATARWLQLLRRTGFVALAVDCRGGKGLQRFPDTVRQSLAELIRARQAKGMAGRPLRLMVVGIPNTGKSSFINRMSNQANRRSRAQVADRPGVTRQNQWFPIGSAGGVKLELLDTPGVLWPKFEDPAVGDKLAFIGSVKDTVLDGEALALRLLALLRRDYPDRLRARYQLRDGTPDGEPWQLLEEIAQRRGMRLPGGEPDLSRAAAALLEDFRSGRLGRVTLDAAG